MTSPDLHEPGEACVACPSRFSQLRKLGLRIEDSDFVIALAGNPNTGKTTVFNALTGLRMHTGNWPGKTISRAEGGFSYEGKRFKMVDLPGTYSLLSASPDEEVARTFLLFGQPDVTRDRGGRHLHGAQSQPDPASAANHPPRRALPQPDGRGPRPRHRDRRPQSRPRSRHSGDSLRRPLRRGHPGIDPGNLDHGRTDR